MNLDLESVLEYGLEPTVDLLNLGFSDYTVPIQLDLAALLQMTSHDSVDLSSCRVVKRGSQAAGVALIARRGWTSRLAAMAIVPSDRGAGIGSWLLRQLIEQARARGEKAMVLEVIESNAPGVRLYRHAGFRTERRLVSYTTTVDTARAVRDDLMFEVDLRELGRAVTTFGLQDLPWQVSGESLAHLGPPSIAFRMGGSYIAISNPEAPQIAVRSLLTLPDARGKGHAARLLRAALARFPGKTWRVPPMCPAELGGLFEQAGFERASLSQLQMRLDWE